MNGEEEKRREEGRGEERDGNLAEVDVVLFEMKSHFIVTSNKSFRNSPGDFLYYNNCCG